MSKQIIGGGPAFPSTLENNGRETISNPMIGLEMPTVTTTNFLGMTLRDYFASAALAGMELTAEDDMGSRFFYGPITIAKRAYSIADAMIAERNGINND